MSSYFYKISRRYRLLQLSFLLCCFLQLGNARELYKKENSGTIATRPTTGPFAATIKNVSVSDANLRPAERACNKIKEGLENPLTIHIIGGTGVALGDYPHMASLGYTRIGEDSGPYDYRCGGALIAEKFVLTAAHCGYPQMPKVIRFGVVDLTNSEQLRHSVQISVKHFTRHENYSKLNKIHDIAIIELEENVPDVLNIYPVCLHTDIADPPPNSKLTVTGFGLQSIQNDKPSSRLLAAVVDIVDRKSCQITYDELPFTLNQGHLCTFSNRSDACQGDSGGPLHLVVNENKKIYHLLGVISVGPGCQGPYPSLNTRVANYVDWIEKIVWPQT